MYPIPKGLVTPGTGIEASGLLRSPILLRNCSLSANKLDFSSKSSACKLSEAFCSFSSSPSSLNTLTSSMVPRSSPAGEREEPPAPLARDCWHYLAGGHGCANHNHVASPRTRLSLTSSLCICALTVFVFYFTC